MKTQSISILALLLCTLGCFPKRIEPTMHKQEALPPALAHSEILPVVDDIFVVYGTNIVVHDGTSIEASRTMSIIRQNQELTLVNSIRLNDATLKKLEKLGRIKNVVRLGAFHGRDDAFYQTTYGAKLWAYPEMEFSRGEIVDYNLDKEAPFAFSKVISFKSTKFKEALLLIEKSGGILISCDTIKNWQEKDPYFSDETFAMMKSSDSVGPAKIDATWLNAMQPSKEEIKALGDLNFSILITAHGPPLVNRAKESLAASIKEALKL